METEKIKSGMLKIISCIESCTTWEQLMITRRLYLRFIQENNCNNLFKPLQKLFHTKLNQIENAISCNN